MEDELIDTTKQPVYLACPGATVMISCNHDTGMPLSQLISILFRASVENPHRKVRYKIEFQDGQKE